MAYQREYQTGESGFDTSEMRDVLPDELSDRYFQNLDVALQRIEGRQMDRTLGELGDRGFLRSGDTFSKVSEDVLGPAVERRNQILLPELRRAAGEGREERMIGEQFGRQKELMALEHRNRLEEMERQAEIRRMLLELEDSMAGQDSSGWSWGQIAGTAAGVVAGSFLPGTSGFVSGAIGNAFGGALDKQKKTDSSRYTSLGSFDDDMNDGNPMKR